MREIKALVLWHYTDGRGKILGASVTEFEGTIKDLQDMIRGDEDVKNSIPHQIVLLPDEQ